MSQTTPETKIPPNTAATLSFPPIPTPSHGAGTAGSFTIACSTSIAAPPVQCLDVILDSTNYPKWNAFCQKITIDTPPTVPVENPPTPGLPSGEGYLARGTKFTLHAHMDLDMNSGGNGRPTGVELSVLERIDDGRRAGWRVAWRTRPTLTLPSWMLRAERVQEFVEAEADPGTGAGVETEYVCWETFYGVLAPVVRTVVGTKVAAGFNAWAEGLKARAEELWRAGK